MVAGVTNVVGSSLSRETDLGVYVHAGPEISVCSTKAFTAQVLATELLALRFARMRDMSAGDGRAWVAGLEGLSGQLRLMLEHSAACKKLAEFWLVFPDQKAITDAADQVDLVLLHHADKGQGTGAVRRLRIDRLEVVYTYSPDDRMVCVVDVDIVG